MVDEEAGKPKYLSDDEKDLTIGVDAAEAATSGAREKGIKTPGWVKYSTYTDAQGNTRHKAEVLVAAGSMATDGTAGVDDDLGGGGGTVYTAGVDYGNTSEFTGGQLVVFNVTPAFATFLQTLAGNETVTYTSYGNTYTTALTTTFSYYGMENKWAASAVNTGGSYADTVSFS